MPLKRTLDNIKDPLFRYFEREVSVWKELSMKRKVLSEDEGKSPSQFFPSFHPFPSILILLAFISIFHSFSIPRTLLSPSPPPPSSLVQSFPSIISSFLPFLSVLILLSFISIFLSTSIPRTIYPHPSPSWLHLSIGS